METHDHQPPVDAAMSHESSAAPAENMRAQVPGSASDSPEPAMPGHAQAAIPDPQAQTAGQPAQFKPNVIMDQATGQLYYAVPHDPSATPAENITARTPGTTSDSPEPATPAMPGHQAQALPSDAARPTSVDPLTQAAIPDPQGQNVSQPFQAMAGQPPQFKPNVIMDPATGQLYYAMPQGQPVQPAPQNGRYVYYTAQSEQAPEQAPEPHQPDYAQIIKSVEDFAEGDASVADVVKTLWTETSQDDQFWKGAIVGAAAAVLLTSQTVRGTMGKTFGGIFGNNAADAAAPPPAPDVDPKTK